MDGIDKTLPYYDPAGPNTAQASLYFGEDNQWPQMPAVFRPVWEDYYKAMEELTAGRALHLHNRSLFSST